MIERHAGFGLRLWAHVCKAIWQFVGEENTNQVEIDTDLNQQEKVKLILLCNAKIALKKVVPFDSTHFYLFSLLSTICTQIVS